jgi:hypothetical protein
MKSYAHDYQGRNIGRGARRASKMVKALNGVASFDLLDEVAREDALRRRAANLQWKPKSDNNRP